MGAKSSNLTEGGESEKYRLSRGWPQVFASHLVKMFDHEVSHGKDSEVVGSKNFACVQ